MMRNSRGHRRACDQRPIVIKRDPLVCDRDDDLERALRSVLGLSILRQFRFCVPVVVLVPERRVIAPPRPLLGPEQELGMCGAYREYENGKCCHYRRAETARPFHGATRSRLTLHMPLQPMALDAGGVRSTSRRGQNLRFGPLSATVQTTDLPLATLVTRSRWPSRSSICAQTRSRSGCSRLPSTATVSSNSVATPP